MSTPKYKKEARQKQLKNEAAIARYKKQLESNKKVKKKEFTEYKMETPYVRETKHYPSLTTSNAIPESCARKESQRYTGTLVRGIATMHKSNAVPVISQEEAEDISKMRRN